MKTRRQRMLLTAVAVAGSVALYGCGGGDSGPDKTPFDQKAVDKAAADAKKKAEEQAAAAAAAAAEAGTAAAEAKKAMEAAADAAKAAADAAKYAMTATLDMAMAMAASTTAATESGKASVAAKAARAAADKARTAASGHQAAMEAEASAKSAEKYAMEAAASATAAMRSYETAQRLTSDRNDTAGLATAAGAHAQTAKKQSEMADVEAGKVKAQVKMAKDATTKKAAEAARTAAMKARDAAADAAKAADDAAKAAEAIDSDAAAVAMRKTEARKYAKSAMASSGKAGMYLDYTAGYADARMARDEAEAGKTDLDKHDDLRMRVPWIAAITTKNAKSMIEDAAKAARNAAESLERSTNEDVITARRNNIASSLAMVEAERRKAADELTAAMEVYDAAKPFSENGMRIDADNLASGESLLHSSGKISVDVDAARLYAPDVPITEVGPDDLIISNYFAKSYGGPLGGSPAQYRYKMEILSGSDRLGLTGGVKYKYVSWGTWGKARDAFVIGRPQPDEVLLEANTFVFADPSNLTKNLPATGTASFIGLQRSFISVFTGNKGTNGADVVVGFDYAANRASIIVPGAGIARTDSGKRFDGFISGIVRGTVDFAKGKVNLAFNSTDMLSYPPNPVDYGRLLYDIEGIDLDRSNGHLSGGTYVGQRSGGRTRTGIIASQQNRYALYSDPFRKESATTGSSYVPTVQLHGGVFGPQSNEIAGTVRLTATAPHGETNTTNVPFAKDGTITVNTSFGLYNHSVPENN